MPRPPTPMTNVPSRAQVSILPWLIAVIALPLTCATCPGCGDTTAEVMVKQPISFRHKIHFAFLTDGGHREEKIRMHMKMLGDDEVPEEILRGECLECHDDLAELADCAGCHLIFQDAKLRARKDIRACVGCHRKTWTGHIASIPSTNVCRCCHSGEPRTDSPEERHLRAYLARGEDIQWVQITTLGPHIHFSHKAHVKYAGYSCTRCHEDMSKRDTPPTTAKVFAMNTCKECHEKNEEAGKDCLTCHK